MKFKNLLLTGVILLVGLSAPIMADEDDGPGYDDERRGTIDAVNLGKRTIVIDDWVYNLALSLRVFEGDKATTDFALRERINVEFDIDPKTTDNAVQMITDIRVLGKK